MTDDSKLSGIPPLGRSVEEIEAEDGNRVNPDTPREEHGGDIPPIPVLGGPSGTALPARGTRSSLLDAEVGGDTSRAGRGEGDDPTDNEGA
ncbi:hypothetical protein [Deinococcus pimensis]|uniref:hypothetical protein n=1 Tax=Deinococcus pimensis TaxID=309888 RepID=UPI0004B0011B|nr:hypothetical protein [Deinococcus pimensis]